ncbi:hypothetical protein HGRIS_008141 [Hohenbuehelia grisea]|uniref:Uncharacterized protein n=1 Tax=Hohenbuehelia grisea TaxID=104357 RepID=A0ABR3J7G6_9AGAR
MVATPGVDDVKGLIQGRIGDAGAKIKGQHCLFKPLDDSGNRSDDEDDSIPVNLEKAETRKQFGSIVSLPMLNFEQAMIWITGPSTQLRQSKPWRPSREPYLPLLLINCRGHDVGQGPLLESPTKKCCL